MAFFKMQQQRTAVLLAIMALIGMSARETSAWSQEQSALIPPQEEALQLNLDALPVLFSEPVLGTLPATAPKLSGTQRLWRVPIASSMAPTFRGFVIGYTLEGKDAVASEKTVAHVAKALEDSWQMIVEEGKWRAPKNAIQTDGYIYYFLNDTSEISTGGYAMENYVAINARGPFTIKERYIRTVVMHEFFHLVEYEYLSESTSAGYESWFGEMTATWVSYKLNDFFTKEPLVMSAMTWYRWYFDNINFTYSEVQSGSLSGLPLRLYEYSPATLQYFVDRFRDESFPRQIWEQIASGQYALEAIDTLAQKKGSSFEKELQTMAVWNYLESPYSFAATLYAPVSVAIQGDHQVVPVLEHRQDHLPQALGANYLKFYPHAGDNVNGVHLELDENISWGITVLGRGSFTQKIFSQSPWAAPNTGLRSLKNPLNASRKAATGIIWEGQLSAHEQFIDIQLDQWGQYDEIVVILQNMSRTSNAKYYWYSTTTISDSDGDGLSDAREEEVGANPHELDTDSDGTLDAEEVQRGWNPAGDTDSDGMADAWEAKYNLDPFDPTDATEDSDRDQMKNVEEYQWDTDPIVFDAPILITNDDESELLASDIPVLSDRAVAWIQENEFGSREVILYRLDRSAAEVVNDPNTHPSHVAIFEDWIVWTEQGTNGEKIVGMNLTAGLRTTFLADEENARYDFVSALQIDGENIIFLAGKYGATDEMLFMFDIRGSVLEQISSVGADVEIFDARDGLIAWKERSTPETHVYNMNTRQKTQYLFPYEQNVSIAITGTMFFYEQNDGVMEYEWSTGKQQFYDFDAGVNYLDADREYLTFVHSSTTESGLFSYDYATGKKRLLNVIPNALTTSLVQSGKTMIWTNYDTKKMERRIFVWFVDRG